MKVPLLVVLLLLNTANVIFHSIGAYLLLCIYKNSRQSAEQVYLIHLSICELLMNLLEVFRRIPDLISHSAEVNEIIHSMQCYLMIAMFTGISVVYYLDMVYFTLDRLLDVLLNIKYPLYWNEAKAKRLVQGTWLFGIVLSIIISLLHYFIGYVWQDLMFKYCFPILDFSFTFLALVTYGFIFSKFKKTRILPSQKGTTATLKTSAFHVLRRSRFHLSFLLILTFLMFIVVPDLTYLFVGVINNNETETLMICCWISYSLSNLSDACIYIFMQKPVKKLLIKKMNIRRARINVHASSTEYSIKTIS